jgi:hypothetical protein
MPTFLDAQRRDINAFDQESLGDEWECKKGEMSVQIMGEYFHLIMKRISKDRYRGDNELGCKARKMELLTFDGTNHISPTTWVQKWMLTSN